MSTQTIQLYVADKDGNPLSGGLTHAVCPPPNPDGQVVSSPSCMQRYPAATVYFSMPSVVAGQCCGYNELYISPPSPYTQVKLYINDLALNYQQCPMLQSDGSAVGVVRLTTDGSPIFFDDSVSTVFLGITDPSPQIGVSGYKVSANVICYPKESCSNFYSKDYQISSYAVPPCITDNGTTSCPDGYCVAQVYNPRSGLQADEYDLDPNSRPHVKCPCTPNRFSSCIQTCGADSTCMISNQSKHGEMQIQYGTCSGCPNIVCGNLQ